MNTKKILNLRRNLALLTPLDKCKYLNKTSYLTGLTKKQIRSKILARLKAQKEEERNKKSKIIKERLFKTPEFIEARTVMFYIAFGGEVNTEDMIKEALKLGKIVAVPVCRKNNRVIRPCRLDSNIRLKKGPYGICEPAIKRFIDVKDLDLVVVPGVAFTRKGSRLGRGKGYYDYFLNKLPKKVASVGLAFDFQILPFIPATKTDVSVKRVISNEDII